MIESCPSGNKLTGFYLGTVIRHLPHGRLKVWIPSIWPDEWKDKPEMLPACMQITPQFAGSNQGNGVFSYPNIGSTVFCGFANGDQNLPFTIGSLLGGPNAFGQYDYIFEDNHDDENVDSVLSSSPRHIITSGKSHIEIFENGKLSVIVVDPDRRETHADFDDNIHSISSTSNVANRPIAEQVENEQLSNIHSKFVLDNDGDVNGYSLINTHWLDLQNINDTSAQYIKNTNITTDNSYSLENNGTALQEMISAGTFFENNGKTQKTITQEFNIVNTHLTKVPSKIEFSTNTELTSNIIDQKQSKTDNQILTNKNIISEELPGKIEFLSELNNTQIISQGNQLTNILEIANFESKKDTRLGHKNSQNYTLTKTVANVPTIVNSNIIADFLAGENETKSNINAKQTKLVNGTPIVDSEVIDQMDTTMAKIEKRVTNKLVATACENLVTMDTLGGMMTIHIINNVSGTECKIQLDKNGIMTVNTTNEVNINTTVTNINSPGGVNIIGNTHITGNLVTTGTTTDCGCTLATHKHPEQQSGDVVSPGVMTGVGIG